MTMYRQTGGSFYPTTEANLKIDTLNAEKNQKQLCIENLKLQLTKLEKENDLRKRIISRLPLCSDHRDKIHDRCVECDNEDLQYRINLHR